MPKSVAKHRLFWGWNCQANYCTQQFGLSLTQTEPNVIPGSGYHRECYQKFVTYEGYRQQKAGEENCKQMKVSRPMYKIRDLYDPYASLEHRIYLCYGTQNLKPRLGLTTMQWLSESSSMLTAYLQWRAESQLVKQCPFILLGNNGGG